MNVAAYLERIGYRGPVDAAERTLMELHTAHMMTVPFENLDIHLGRPIVLEVDALFEKIVVKRRGGFCYELNGLFCELLKALGFRVSMLSAGVARKAGGFGPEFDHMTLLVLLEQPWLADVGFGDSFVEPLLLGTTDDQFSHGSTFRIESGDGRRILLRRKQEGEWEPQYRLSLQSRDFQDYREMCLYHQSSPQSSFTRNKIVTLATRQGRVTLSEMRLITTRLDGQRHERELPDEVEYRTVLADLFGICLE